MHRRARGFVVALATCVAVVLPATPALADSQANTLSTPYGTLTSNVWRTGSDGSVYGNTRQWDFQVSATVDGSQSVAEIKTTWTGSASLRNGASWSVAGGVDSVSVGGGSSWQYASNTESWSNTNGARSNMIAAPAVDYRSGTVYLVNTAYVKFNGDARNFSISAGV
jgi:hypothetical protein